MSGFVHVCLVRPGAPWLSLSSFGFIWFVWLFPGGRCVRSCSYGSFACTLVVVGFVFVRLARPGGLSLGTFGFVCFVWVRVRFGLVRPFTP